MTDRENLRRIAATWLDFDYVDGNGSIGRAVLTLLDELEAAERRYAYLKTATHGALHWDDGWLAAEDSDEWDRMIDSAMENNHEHR